MGLDCVECVQAVYNFLYYDRFSVLLGTTQKTAPFCLVYTVQLTSKKQLLCDALSVYNVDNQ